MTEQFNITEARELHAKTTQCEWARRHWRRCNAEEIIGKKGGV